MAAPRSASPAVTTLLRDAHPTPAHHSEERAARRSEVVDFIHRRQEVALADLRRHTQDLLTAYYTVCGYNEVLRRLGQSPATSPTLPAASGPEAELITSHRADILLETVRQRFTEDDPRWPF